MDNWSTNFKKTNYAHRSSGQSTRPTTVNFLQKHTASSETQESNEEAGSQAKVGYVALMVRKFQVA